MPATAVSANHPAPHSTPKVSQGNLGFFYRIGLTAGRIFPAIADLASNEVYVLASAIAFNALLALYPFLLLVLLTCQEVLHWNAGVETTLFLLKNTYLPVAEDFIVRNLRVVLEAHTHRGVAVFSIVALIFTSAGIFTPLELALNRAWRVKQPRSGWKSQLLAMGLVPVCGGCFLLIVAVTAGLQWLTTQTLGSAGAPRLASLITVVGAKVLSLPITIGMLFGLYLILPSERPAARRVLPMAIWVGLLWEAAHYVFVACLPLIDFRKTYGPFYVTVSLVMWAFLSSLLLLLGANLAALDTALRPGAPLPQPVAH
ncbi:MAG: YihY/virulence factor BrkB family protein [Acidobacteriota bacterium]